MKSNSATLEPIFHKAPAASAVQTADLVPKVGFTAILPAAIVQVASRAARIWCVVRSLDHPDNGGTGCGLVRINLETLIKYLRRSERSVWRYIKEAKAKGYFHRCDFVAGEFEIEYTGLRPLAKKLGLPGLGAIGEFPLQEIEFAKAKAAEIQTEDLQRQSFHMMKKEWGPRFSKGAKSAAELLTASASSARVSGDALIARGSRCLYLAPHWRPFGASQAGIADRLGVSLRTLQYRLSEGWRVDKGLPAIDKAQTAHQVLSDCPKQFLRDFYRLEENAPQRFIFMGARLFERGCNLYQFSDTWLRSCRFRKAEYRQAESVLQESRKKSRRLECSENTTRVILEDLLNI